MNPFMADYIERLPERAQPFARAVALQLPAYIDPFLGQPSAQSIFCAIEELRQFDDEPDHAAGKSSS